jgi:hypothetical protein
VQDTTRRGANVVWLRLCDPVVHRDDHERGTASRHRLVVRAGDRARHVLRADGLVEPHGILAREAPQAAGEKRLGREVAAVLLADEHDERRAVDARGGERGDPVAETRRRVQDRERGPATTEGVAGRHADDGALVQSEHEAEVVRQVGQQQDLRRARVRKQRRQVVLTEHVERRVADGSTGHVREPTGAFLSAG